MDKIKQPTLNLDKIQEVANDAAEKAYLKEVDNYYTSYDSPYRKMIKEELEKQKFKWSMDLPKILDKLNSALAKEVDKIANNAIASTFIPMVNDALTGMDKNITMRYFLKEVISELEPDRDEQDEFSFSFTKDDRHGWLSCELFTSKSNYEFTLHHHKDNTYQLLSFPRNKYKSGYNSNMTIYKEDVKIEMPFTQGILSDKVLKLFFKMMLSGSIIEMDCDGFDEDMFPEQEHCHC